MKSLLRWLCSHGIHPLTEDVNFYDFGKLWSVVKRCPVCLEYKSMEYK